MWPTRAALLVGLAGAASALLVAPNSPCSQYCGNVLSNTTGADMVCPDSSFSGSTVFETCIDCELNSGYASGNETDLQWLIYNLRYAVSFCLFGDDNPNVQDNPCQTTTACGLLGKAFDYGNLTQDVGAYDYCQDWIETSVPKCTGCLDSSDMTFMSNYVIVMDAACSQLPAPGDTLSVAGTPFTSTHMNITTPSASPLYTYTPSTGPLTLGSKVGIAIGGLVFLLFLAGVAIVCTGRRRRRAYLRSVAARYAGKNAAWPSPPLGGGGGGGGGSGSGDMFGTPMSQKPLRGWDDTSPVSAGGAASGGNGSGSGGFPRYFSPYSSQYNSPVSAASDGPGNYAWPTQAMMASAFAGDGDDSGAGAAGLIPPPAPYYYTSAQGVVDHQLQQQRQQQQQHEQMVIGMALGGADPSLHSRPSNGSLASTDNGTAGQTTAAAEAAAVVSSSQSSKSSKSRPGSPADRASQASSGAAVEDYELAEINNGGHQHQQQQQQTPNQAPLLQHPGYGRGSIKYYPPPPTTQWEPAQQQAQPSQWLQQQPPSYFTEGDGR